MATCRRNRSSRSRRRSAISVTSIRWRVASRRCRRAPRPSCCHRSMAWAAACAALVRHGQLDDAAIDRTRNGDAGACRPVASRAGRGATARRSYRQRRAGRGRQSAGELAEVIPQVFARLRVVQPAPTLYFPVSPSSGRRRPGSSPFLSPARLCRQDSAAARRRDCTQIRRRTDWWERELPSIMCAETPGGIGDADCAAPRRRRGAGDGLCGDRCGDVAGVHAAPARAVVRGVGARRHRRVVGSVSGFLPCRSAMRCSRSWPRAGRRSSDRGLSRRSRDRTREERSLSSRDRRIRRLLSARTDT